ncbi:hypothetical protein BCh11DRAFT_02460 [Burkholderia sp. Ch1-1]|uniref:Uncharacterized protein n=1 Tax=Paraburkholderia dioscoreae TaxID=2604047 RepID=A0A5Q4YWL9_9BURK|nr:hypothetical protein BCh11DRAFT_02460 [Burkholderia sp. Ch1-1]VVD33807.1 conserved protein of unknown function [Paraburkholderia dioscoreae]
MDELTAATSAQTAIMVARLAGAVDSLSCSIAGFALLAGARAFMFIALLGWREPVLGGAGLVLLASVGWLRWQCGAASTLPATQKVRATAHSGKSAACRGHGRPLANVCGVACYNRSLEAIRSAVTPSSSRAPAVSGRLERGREPGAPRIRKPTSEPGRPAANRT